jgi:hypothetical protein
MASVPRPGGAFAAYVWDYAEKMELIRYFWDAAVSLDPSALGLDEGRRFRICKPSPLAVLLLPEGIIAFLLLPPKLNFGRSGGITMKSAQVNGNHPAPDAKTARGSHKV